MRKNKSEEKHIGLRIDSETHSKLKNLAAYEGRSINGELLYLIRQAIAAHEKENNMLDSVNSFSQNQNLAVWQPIVSRL